MKINIFHLSKINTLFCCSVSVYVCAHVCTNVCVCVLKGGFNLYSFVKELIIGYTQVSSNVGVLLYLYEGQKEISKVCLHITA